jgi:hypothetical protein
VCVSSTVVHYECVCRPLRGGRVSRSASFPGRPSSPCGTHRAPDAELELYLKPAALHACVAGPGAALLKQCCSIENWCRYAQSTPHAFCTWACFKEAQEWSIRGLLVCSRVLMFWVRIQGTGTFLVSLFTFLGNGGCRGIERIGFGLRWWG